MEGGGKGGVDEGHQRRGERRAERSRLLRKSTGMEGAREEVNRGGSKSSGGHRGREMAAMNK